MSPVMGVVSMGSRSNWKRHKMGMLPGNIGKGAMANMLEKNTPIQIFSWQVVSNAQAKSFRKRQHRRALKAFRQQRQGLGVV